MGLPWAMAFDPKQLVSRVQALKAEGLLEEALALLKRATEQNPASGVAEHNLAAALGDAGRWREAEPHIRNAFSRGLDAGESWLVHARCLQALGRLDEAERAFAQAWQRRPQLYEARRDLAQLRWMRSGDIKAALADIEAALRSAPNDERLGLVKAQVLEYAGQDEAACALLLSLAARHPANLQIVFGASQLAAKLGRGAAALSLAERACVLAPNDLTTAIALIIACLTATQVERASLLAEAARAKAPKNQHAIALQATAWRLLGDDRYRELYDYKAFVSAALLETPPSWSTLAGYIADLVDALRRLHVFVAHPFDQSIRGGTQVPDILQCEHPALRALPKALEGPIARVLTSLGQGGDPLRSRNRGRYSFTGMWSIRMGPGGRHIDHVHPDGWISAVCYIEVPSQRSGTEGWIKFGQAGIHTSPALDAEHYVDPAPGMVVLFPSYMWHGTVPFTRPEPRMTVAFDLAPG